MSIWTTYALVYLAGIATPVIFLRRVLGKSEDGSSCFLNVILALLGILCILVIWLGLN